MLLLAQARLLARAWTPCMQAPACKPPPAWRADSQYAPPARDAAALGAAPRPDLGAYFEDPRVQAFLAAEVGGPPRCSPACVRGLQPPAWLGRYAC